MTTYNEYDEFNRWIDSIGNVEDIDDSIITEYILWKAALAKKRSEKEGALGYLDRYGEEDKDIPKQTVNKTFFRNMLRNTINLQRTRRDNHRSGGRDRYDRRDERYGDRYKRYEREWRSYRDDERDRNWYRQEESEKRSYKGDKRDRDRFCEDERERRMYRDSERDRSWYRQEERERRMYKDDERYNPEKESEKCTFGRRRKRSDRGNFRYSWSEDDNSLDDNRDDQLKYINSRRDRDDFQNGYDLETLHKKQDFQLDQEKDHEGRKRKFHDYENNLDRNNLPVNNEFVHSNEKDVENRDATPNLVNTQEVTEVYKKRKYNEDPSLEEFQDKPKRIMKRIGRGSTKSKILDKVFGESLEDGELSRKEKKRLKKEKKKEKKRKKKEKKEKKRLKKLMEQQKNNIFENQTNFDNQDNAKNQETGF